MDVVFCIPGNTFSNKFLVSWTSLISSLDEHDIGWTMFNKYSPYLHQVRNTLLNKNNIADQVPWDGKIPYDYIMWIDSDTVFNPEQFHQLLKHDKDIVSGIYLKKTGNRVTDDYQDFACSIYEDENTVRSLSINDIVGKKQLIEVFGNGMGWMLVKKGVFESLKYPWFEDMWYSPDNNCWQFYGEDMMFQIKARDKGFKSYIDPTVIVGHEKLITL